MNEKDLYKKARRQDVIWYLLALTVIVIGFFTTEVFSVASLVSVGILGLWGVGVARRGKLETECLHEAEPLIRNLVSQGFTEHDAMLKLGVDKFYYKPFWAIR
jgi:hypothetical protein